MKTEQQAGGPAAPAAPAQADLPEWLSTIPGVDLEAVRGNKDLVKTINEGWLRQQDYTKKTQEVAPLRKALGDEDPVKAVEELSSWRRWRQEQWPAIEQRMSRIDELERQAKANDRAPSGDQPAPAGRYKLDVGDLYEQERLDKAVGGLEDHLVGRAEARRKEWWEKEELPRIDTQAKHYVNNVIALMEVIWPKEMREKGVTINRLLKEAVVTQNGDYIKLAEGMISGSATTEKDAYQRGYDQALKEAGEKGKAAAGSPPPPSYGSPTWKRPPGGTGGQNGARRSNSAETFAEVMRDVGSRHGALPV